MSLPDVREHARRCVAACVDSELPTDSLATAVAHIITDAVLIERKATESTLSGIVAQARKVRQAQRAYFASRDKMDLLAAKTAEADLDKMLNKVVPER